MTTNAFFILSLARKSTRGPAVSEGERRPLPGAILPRYAHPKDPDSEHAKDCQHSCFN
eukprot:COSAG04_NODE_4302_length_2172_cov_1.568259_5_plen_57_part_01